MIPVAGQILRSNVHKAVRRSNNRDKKTRKKVTRKLAKV